MFQFYTEFLRLWCKFLEIFSQRPPSSGITWTCSAILPDTSQHPFLSLNESRPWSSKIQSQVLHLRVCFHWLWSFPRRLHNINKALAVYDDSNEKKKTGMVMATLVKQQPVLWTFEPNKLIQIQHGNWEFKFK